MYVYYTHAQTHIVTEMCVNGRRTSFGPPVPDQASVAFSKTLTLP